MTAQGHKLALSLTDHPTPSLKAGVHIPPFSSVPHLHLHVFVLPHTTIGRFKYPISSSRRISPSPKASAPQRGGNVEWVEGAVSHGNDMSGEGKGKGKGWSWFVSAEQTMGILERGGTVGLGRG